jgi:hypothetical protein
MVSEFRIRDLSSNNDEQFSKDKSDSGQMIHSTFSNIIILQNPRNESLDSWNLLGCKHVIQKHVIQAILARNKTLLILNKG